MLPAAPVLSSNSYSSSSASSKMEQNSSFSVSKEEELELQENLKLAIRCNEYIQSLQIISPNNCADLMKSVETEMRGPVLEALSDSLGKLRLEAEEFEVIGKVPEWATETMKSIPANKNKYYVAICEGAKKFHLGNCYEMSLLVLAYLEQIACHQKYALVNISREVESTSNQGKVIWKEEYTHSFLMLCGNPNTLVVIDPWNRCAPYYTFNQINEKLKSCRSGFQQDGSPVLINFSDKDQVAVEYIGKGQKKLFQMEE